MDALTRTVAEAAQALLARGERPTVRRVRAYLGKGSFEALAPALRAWWVSQKDVQGAAQSNWAGERERLKAEASDREALAYERLEGLRRHLMMETDAARGRARQAESDLVAALKRIEALKAENYALMEMLRTLKAQEHKPTDEA